MSRGEVARLIDHTLLRPEATQHDIEVLCREALDFQFANVCINPTWVTLAAQLLSGNSVGVCAVVGFPLGATTSDAKACRGSASDRRRCARDRYGHQHRRAQIRRSLISCCAISRA